MYFEKIGLENSGGESQFKLTVTRFNVSGSNSRILSLDDLSSNSSSSNLSISVSQCSFDSLTTSSESDTSQQASLFNLAIHSSTASASNFTSLYSFSDITVTKTASVSLLRLAETSI